MALTELEQKLVEENMGLVGKVIKDCVHRLSRGASMTMTTCSKSGVWDCAKRPSPKRLGRAHSPPMPTSCIRNEIYDALDYAARRGREQATDPSELPCVALEDEDLGQAESCRELLSLLDRAETAASGVVAKGIRAIRLQAQGYSNREIGEQYGVPANYVTAWVAKARKLLTSMRVQTA